MSFLLRSPSSSYLQMQLHLKPDYSFFIASASMMASTSLGPSTLLSYASSSSSSSRQFHDFGFRLILGHEGVRVPSFRRFRIHCESKEKEVRTSSPVIESLSLSGDAALRSNEWKAVPDIWRSSAEKYGDRVALVDPYHDPPLKLTYKQLEQDILDFAEGLRVVGMKANEKIGLFADNSCRWLVSDQGIMATGAVNVVRGSRSSVEELLQIYRHSESVALVVDNPEFFNRIAETFTSKASLRFLILLWGEKSSLVTQGLQVPVYSYADIKSLGQESRAKSSGSNDTRNYNFINSDDVAAIMYTSGTTGNPKGVMLTHRNLLQQIKHLSKYVPAQAGDKFLSMLPSWHAYERACEYFIFTCGIEQMYTSIRYLKDDLKRYQPNYIVSVPLVYETLYSGIQKQISSSSAARKFLALTLIKVSMAYMEMKRIYEGTCLTKEQKPPMYIVALVDWLFARVVAALLWPLHMLAKMLIYKKIHASIGISKAGISGGGSLPIHVDKFFEAIGVTLQNGYGLTETSPVVCARTLSYNVLGSAGHPMHGTEFKIVDPETNDVLPPGTKGIIKVRGPQVMKGYYKNPLTTKQVLNESGWFNTGDTGWIAPHHSIGRSRRCGGVIVLEGRAKDTIVLSTGENVEPLEIEEAAMRSSLIEQILVIGQDRRRLGAIVIPNKEEAQRVDPDISKEKLKSLIYQELREWTSECSFQVGPVLIIDEPFTIDNGLMTPTMKVRRDKVVAKYKDEIDQLYT
ncbi:PREDICTED: long-chain-fatty-acid--[acyl-carrier-protein] ligase AEE15, chloroplastic-like [Camelina sativa]|uniref:Long-chain-fatty-acid--[acyl-carrier-protein] ligase AEE15, chloroplastic-like n=1 Tax=Camelina sativa TaxID=90675 RepID=A0ABM0V386_CAMSA|nr:PREDICTED: long-chain-fatty-acid--[acyl-carrier-protein] ligase AEE15, chloroplastic-like [Camelina sativa]